jgi:5-methylcytosine-specific restriction endonuclease McrA
MTDRRVSAVKKRRLEERARGCCEYCRSPVAYSMQSFAVDHVDSTEDEGGETLENLAFVCQGCNNHKYAKTQAPDPDTSEAVSLFHPRQTNEHPADADGHAWCADLERNDRSDVLSW